MADMGERKLAPDVVSYNTLLKSLGLQGSRLHWSGLLADMRSSSVQPNRVTFSSLMSNAAQEGDSGSVEELMERAQSDGVETGVFAFNILMQAHIRRSDWRSAQAVMNRMRQESLDPDVVTYTTLMKGQPEGAVQELLEEMRRSAVQPNFVSFTTLLSSLSSSQQVKAALKISKDLQQEASSKEIPLSPHLACAILHACKKSAAEPQQLDILESSSLADFASQVFQLVAKPDAACRRAFTAVLSMQEGGNEKSHEKYWPSRGWLLGL